MEQETKKEVITKEVKCPRCKYVWNTKTKFYYVTCPKCYYKIKIVDFKPSQN